MLPNLMLRSYSRMLLADVAQNVVKLSLNSNLKTNLSVDFRTDKKA